MTMPNLRPSAPREHVDPQADRRTSLGYREAALDARERALEAERRLLDQERARLDQRERALEATRDLAGDQTNVVPLDGRSPQQIQALADRLIRAGQQRRGELGDDDLASEQTSDLPSNLQSLPRDPQARAKVLADALVLAGRRRRGEV